MKTIIFALLITLIGCSETSNSVKPVSDSNIPDTYNIYVINSNSHYGGDSVQVHQSAVVLFRDGEIFLEYPIESNPLISIH